MPIVYTHFPAPDKVCLKISYAPIYWDNNKLNNNKILPYSTNRLQPHRSSVQYHLSDELPHDRSKTKYSSSLILLFNTYI